MRSSLRRLSIRFSLLLLFAPLARCLKDEGETCQLDGDCSSGLVCSIAPNTARGTCKTTAAAADAGGTTNAEGDADVPLPKEDAAVAGQDGG